MPGRAYPLPVAAAVCFVATAGDRAAVAAKSRADVQSPSSSPGALDGGTPNGPSTNAVISQDRRWSRYVAFESEASDLTRGDTNGAKDVFVVRRDRRRVLVGAVVRRLPLVCQERSLRSSQYEDPVPPAAPPQRPPPENRQVYMRYLGPV